MPNCFGRAWNHEFDMAALQRATPLPGAVDHYAPDRVADIRHVKLDLTLHYEKKRIEGSVTHTIRAVADPLDRIEFDAVDLAVTRATRDGRDTPFQAGDTKLAVTLDPALPMGETADLQIHYSATEPILGLYFITPDAGYPDKPKQVWTQGEDEDSKYWFPCHDFPNQKATSEMIVRVPKGWYALSNGKLLEKADEGGMTRFHWKLGVPHVTYLTTLAAGEFVEAGGEWDGIPVTYLVSPGREADGKRSFADTPKMVEFFSKRVGVRYPYEKYAEIAVADFIFGGMENTSATTQTDLTLHDERAHLDFSSHGLVAHELAHQWFGDLLTCRDWSHAWLNEGFATFLQALWYEEDRGREEYRYEVRGAQRSHIASEAGERRPIVCRNYEEPLDLFDTHIYQKGSCILHMLRHQLGDDAFFRAIRHYVAKHRETNVETPDLIRAIEEATGRNMQRFFDQWVFKAGHPELEVAWSWDEAKKQGILNVKQKQKVDAHTPLFHLPIDVEIFGASGKETRRIEIERDDQSFVFDLPEAPKGVKFDSNGWTLKTIKFPRPKKMLEFLLKEDEDCTGRIEAAIELGNKGEVEPLQEGVLRDKFWGVQAECAKALGKIRSEKALDALITCLKVKHPKARRAVVGAIGGFRGDKAAAALVGVIRGGDESYLVEAEAASGLGKTRSDQALDGLRDAFKKDSWNNVIRTSACAGLAALERAEGLDLLADWVAYGMPQLVRGAAFRAIGRLGRAHPDKATRALDLLLPYLDEPGFRTRVNIIGALRTLGDDRAIPALSPLTTMKGEGRIRRSAREAISAIRKGSTRKEDVSKIRADLDKIVHENRKLRDRLDRIEGKDKTKPKPKKRAAKPKKKAKRKARKPKRRKR